MLVAQWQDNAKLITATENRDLASIQRTNAPLIVRQQYHLTEKKREGRMAR